MSCIHIDIHTHVCVCVSETGKGINKGITDQKYQDASPVSGIATMLPDRFD